MERLRREMGRTARGGRLIRGFMAVLAAGAVAATPGAGDANEGGGARVRIIARVLPIARIRNMEQPAVVQVSEADVARGYLEIRQGSRFMLQANAPYSVTFTRTATWIESATVRGLGSDVVVGMEGGTYQRPRPTTTRVDSVLDYRFRLATDTLPGTYDWPLVMTLNVSP